MYSSYSEVRADDPRVARQAERAAFDHVITHLENARQAKRESSAVQESLDAADRLWTALLYDLGQPANALPDTLRAQLISVGLWVLREVERVRTMASNNFEGLIAVNAIVRAGLR